MKRVVSVHNYFGGKRKSKDGPSYQQTMYRGHMIQSEKSDPNRFTITNGRGGKVASGLSLGRSVKVGDAKARDGWRVVKQKLGYELLEGVATDGGEWAVREPAGRMHRFDSRVDAEAHFDDETRDSAKDAPDVSKLANYELLHELQNLPPQYQNKGRGAEIRAELNRRRGITTATFKRGRDAMPTNETTTYKGYKLVKLDNGWWRVVGQSNQEPTLPELKAYIDKMVAASAKDKVVDARIPPSWHVEVWSRSRSGRPDKLLFEASYDIEAETKEQAIKEVVEMGWPKTNTFRATKTAEGKSYKIDAKDTPSGDLLRARAILEPLGIRINSFNGEYRVNFKNGMEATAYYTDDIDDAIGTGKAMAEHRSNKR